MEEYIAIPPAEDYTVSLTTLDCFMIPLCASSLLLNGLPYKLYLRRNIIDIYIHIYVLLSRILLRFSYYRLVNMCLTDSTDL